EGDWSYEQLERMNSDFVGAVETAFRLRLESRAAAAATVRVGVARSGSSGAAIESALESAWDLLRSRCGDLTALEVVCFVQKLCPGISRTHVKLGLAQRFRERGIGW